MSKTIVAKIHGKHDTFIVYEVISCTGVTSIKEHSGVKPIR